MSKDPATITDHAFVPRGFWYTTCAECGLAEAAHERTTIDSRSVVRGTPRLSTDLLDVNPDTGHTYYEELKD